MSQTAYLHSYSSIRSLKRATLVSKTAKRFPGHLLQSPVWLVNKGLREWACLDSNQGPLPYQRSALTG